MTTSMMTPETAPRDAVQLQAVGPYIHRRLAEALAERGVPVWTDERTKVAFVTASVPDRAQMLATKLAELDAKNGGAPPQTQQAPSAAPADAPPPPAQAAQTPPASLPSGRSPQKANTAGAPAAAKGDAPTGNVVELLTAVKAIQTDIGKLSAVVGKGGTSAETQELRAMLAASMKIQELSLGVLCLLGENILGAPTADFITDGPQYGASALTAISESGKAGG